MGPICGHTSVDDPKHDVSPLCSNGSIGTQKNGNIIVLDVNKIQSVVYMAVRTPTVHIKRLVKLEGYCYFVILLNHGISGYRSQ